MGRAVGVEVATEAHGDPGQRREVENIEQAVHRAHPVVLMREGEQFLELVDDKSAEHAGPGEDLSEVTACGRRDDGDRPVRRLQPRHDAGSQQRGLAAPGRADDGDEAFSDEPLGHLGHKRVASEEHRSVLVLEGDEPLERRARAEDMGDGRCRCAPGADVGEPPCRLHHVGGGATDGAEDEWSQGLRRDGITVARHRTQKFGDLRFVERVDAETVGVGEPFQLLGRGPAGHHHEHARELI